MKIQHILILPSWYPHINNRLSGIFFKDQAEAIAKNKNLKVGCIAINEVGLRDILKKNIAIFDYSRGNVNKVFTINFLFPFANRFKKVRRFIRLQIFKILFKKYLKYQGVPELIHIHSFHYGDFALWIKKKYAIDYIVTEHSSGFIREIYDKEDMKLAEEVFQLSKTNIAVSEKFKQLLIDTFDKPFVYIPNFIDTDFFSLKPNNKNNTTIKLINIAFLSVNKQQKMLIKAFNMIFKNNKNIELLIVGNGEEYHNLQNLIDKLDMKNQIKLYGRASREEIKALLHGSDIFVLSSLFETFGVVLLEAMSCGLPVLSTESGGPNSIIIDKKYGELCENNIKFLAHTMKHSIENIDKYNKYDIREYIINNFSQDFVLKKLLYVYTSAIE